MSADDLLLFHEYIEAAISMEWIYASVVCIIIFYYRRWLRLQFCFPLLMALCFFGVSAIVDRIHVATSLVQPKALMEEGTKFLGIISWTFFHIQSALRSSLVPFGHNNGSVSQVSKSFKTDHKHGVNHFFYIIHKSK